MAVSIYVGCDINSQSMVNNTSNVTCWVSVEWTGGSYNLLEKSGYMYIDDTRYDFTSPFNTDQTTSGSARIFSKTLNIKHDDDGTKTISVRARYVTGVSSGTIAAGTTVELTAITSVSVLSTPPSTGTLGTAMTFTITRKNATIKDSMTFSYKVGSASRYIIILSESSAAAGTRTVTWVPPLSWASDSTSSTTIAGKLTFNCLYGNQTIYSKSYTINLELPASIKPTVDSIELLSDGGHEDKYGAAVKGVTSLQYQINTLPSYDAKIASGTVQIGNATRAVGKIGPAKTESGTACYAGYAAITPTEAGDLTLTATMKDARGRTGSASITKTVLDYTQPVIVKLTVLRCNEDGTENDQGPYVQAKFTATATDLNGVNAVKYALLYKKSTETDYTTVELNSITDPYSVTDHTYIFAADTGSSYNLELRVSDDFYTVKRATVVSTAFTLMHWNADGTGMGIGKISEESNLLDIGLPTRFTQPVYGTVMGLSKLPEIPANSDLNDYMEFGAYAVYQNSIAETIANMPVAAAGRLEVSSTTGEGLRVSEWSYLRQRFIPYMLGYSTWERDVTRSDTNIWTYGEWYRTNLSAEASSRVYDTVMQYTPSGTVLWGGDMDSGWYMRDDQTATLSQKVSEQANGIVLVFCYFNGTSSTNISWQTAYVPKTLVSLVPGAFHTFKLSNDNFATVGMKRLYINDDSIVGNVNNILDGTAASGITYENNKFVLRYVIGV